MVSLVSLLGLVFKLLFHPCITLNVLQNLNEVVLEKQFLEFFNVCSSSNSIVNLESLPETVLPPLAIRLRPCHSPAAAPTMSGIEVIITAQDEEEDLLTNADYDKLKRVPALIVANIFLSEVKVH